MKETFKIVIPLLCVILFSCKDVKQEEKYATAETEAVSHQITLINDSDNQGLGIQLFDEFGNTELIEFNHIDTQQVISSLPVTFFLMLSTSDLRLFQLYPGETVSIEDGEAGSYNLMTSDSIRNNELMLSNKLSFSIRDFGSGAVSEQEADALYEHRITQLHAYQQSHAVSEKFTAYINSFIRAFKTNNSIKAAVMGQKLSEFEQWKNVINEDTLFGSVPYSFALNSFNRLIRDSLSSSGNYGIDKHHRFIQGLGLHTDVEDHLLFELNKNYKVAHDLDKLEEAIHNYSPAPKYSHFKEYLQKNLELTRLSSSAVRGNDIMHLDGSTASLESILEEHRNKVVYIDFWASWCGPCLAQMPFSKKIEKSFKGQEVAFLTLSMDKDRHKWEKKSGELELNPENNYLMVSNFDSPLALALKVKEIPRYILINRKGQIANQRAPRPQDPELAEEIQSLLK